MAEQSPLQATVHRMGRTALGRQAAGQPNQTARGDASRQHSKGRKR